MNVTTRMALTIALSLNMTVAWAGNATAKPSELPPVHVLVWGATLDPELVRRLEQDGVRVVHDSSATLSMERLRLFDMVLAPNFYGLNPPSFAVSQQVQGYFNGKANLPLLRRYVEEGGGLFMALANGGGGQQVARGWNAFLEPWGAMLVAAEVRDDAHAGLEKQYAWTDSGAASPVRAGVKRIWYPTNLLRWDDAYATMPFVLQAPEWRPVLKGMPGSMMARNMGGAWAKLDNRGEAPVIAAVRQAGKGRVAVMGISSLCTMLSPFAKGGWVGESNIGAIEGIFFEKGDGKSASDGYRLLLNTIRWVGGLASQNGMDGYTPEKLAAVPAPTNAPIPAWLGEQWSGTNRPFKVLIGARSSFSDGQGTIAEYAQAAKTAGYSLLAMTETLERFDPARWDEFAKACRAASTPDLIVTPGLDLADPWQNRYLLMGDISYPPPFMLTPDGKCMVRTEFLALGFGSKLAAIHRPSSTPMPQELYKFAQAISLYTYRDGKLVDNGLPAYEWHVNSRSALMPLVVHEVFSPADVAKAAADPQQLYTCADTPENAAWYFYAGMEQYWAFPQRALVTSGPMITRLVSANGQYPSLSARSDAPITDVRLVANYDTERRWRPNATNIAIEASLSPSHMRCCYFVIQDAKGRTAITPPLYLGYAMRYDWRCSDHQNYFGFAWPYPGTDAPDFEPVVPVPGYDEGRGLFPESGGAQRGDNLVSLMSFPYASPALQITDMTIDQRYWHALKQDLIYDAKPPQTTTRSRVWAGRIRYYDFGLVASQQDFDKDAARKSLMKEIVMELRMPVAPDSPIFPAFTRVDAKADYALPQTTGGADNTGKVERGYIDLPVGGCAGNLIALSEGIRVGADGTVGFAVPPDTVGLLPVGTRWTGRFIRVDDPAKLTATRAAMGLCGKTPYTLTLSRGRLDRLAFVAELTAADRGVSGEVTAAPAMPYALPLSIAGLNPHWETGLWREGQPPDSPIPAFGVFEGKGIARLDVTKPGAFYAGNLLMADDLNLRLSIVGSQWTLKSITLEANNTTETDVETTVTTPVEIKDRYRLNEKIKVPAGMLLRFTFPKPAGQ